MEKGINELENQLSEIRESMPENKMKGIIAFVKGDCSFPESTSLSKGEKSELRRAVLKHLKMSYPKIDYFSSQAVLFKLAAQFDLPFFGDPPTNDSELQMSEKWALWLFCIVSLNDLHQENVSLGRAFREAELSQIRFLRLLNSNGGTFVKEMISAIHILRSKGQTVDLMKISFIIFPKGEEAKEARLNIARDYFFNNES